LVCAIEWGAEGEVGGIGEGVVVGRGERSRKREWTRGGEMRGLRSEGLGRRFEEKRIAA